MCIDNLIEKIFSDHDLWYEWSINGEDEVEVSIEMGDWKHDHLYLDYVMSENGFVLVGEDITDENGTDSYSSIHYFKKK